MRIIAYTYEADVHCPDCASERFAHTGAKGYAVDSHSHPMSFCYGRPGYFTSQHSGVSTELDEHLIPMNATDCEGNPVHPVFTTDEHDFTHCGDCGAEL